MLNLLSFFNIYKGHKRSVLIKKNITLSFVIKGLSIIVGFLMVPMALNYLNSAKYGIWLTISSILVWFTFFEIGLGSGLRNKLAEALAKKKYQEAKIYVSTTYAVLSIIMLFITIVFNSINQILDWTAILNVDSSMAEELQTLAFIVFNLFFLQFVTKLISIVLYADQRPALANSIVPIGNFLSLISLYIITKTTDGSLVYLSIIFSVTPILVMLLFSIILYLGKYSNIAPSIKYVRFSYAGNLFNLGIKFFMIQVSGLILYQTTNIIISHFFGPAEVTPYMISYKLFATINMIFTIILTPFWSAFTEAWQKKEILWIKRSLRKLLKIWSIIGLLEIIILLFSPYIYKIWIGDSVKIPFSLSFLQAVYFVTFSFGGIFTMFINGVGKIKLQLYSAGISALMFFPLAYIFVKVFGMGVEGLATARIIVNIYGVVLAPIQVYKILNFKAKGIWNK